MAGKNVALVGATGAVGTEMLKVLEKRNFPVNNLKLFAAPNDKGQKINFKGKTYTVDVITGDSFKDVDIALFSAGGSVSEAYSGQVVESGAVMIDNSSAFRMTEGVPLVTPEVNPEDIKKHKGIIANPNCSTIIMVVALFPIYKVSKIKRIVVSTYQAASGAGQPAMDELAAQSGEILAGKTPTKNVFPHQIAFNLFSHNTTIGENGYCEEEMKMINETKKMFHDDEIKVSATTIRVPIMRAHSESINIELEKRLELNEVYDILKKAPGVKIVDDREKNYFPMPVDATFKDEVLVGRVRHDLSCNTGLDMFVCGDQILKGAALNAVQIAEHLL
jgi:aspartate-semialdehyde dehydrogenase